MTSQQSSIPPVLSLKGITKKFGAILANSNINIDVHAGEIHALLGENGAGKSTLMSIISGRYRPDQGELLINGQRTAFSSPAAAMACGIGMVYQRFMLIEQLSVLENIMLGSGQDNGFLLDTQKAAAKINELSARFGLSVDPEARVVDLSMGERQRVEIMKLLYKNASILIFDEPTSILTPPEVETFFATLRKLAAQGNTIIFITHKLDEVMRLADRISIMRRGKMVAHLFPSQVSSKRELARLMVGREVVLKVDKDNVKLGQTVIRVTELAGLNNFDRPAYSDINFEIQKGEIFAITGVAGNGQEQLIASLAGLHPVTSGQINFCGRDYHAPDWAGNRPQTIAYVPEDRDKLGTVPNQNLTDNMLLTRLDEFCSGQRVQYPKARQFAENAIADYSIYTPSGSETLARQLSGGNLQKLIFAREIGKQPDLLIAEQPTQGLDIGATEDVWQALIRQRQHSAILLVSGDLKEVLSLADRIAVMFHGRFMRIVSASNPEEVSRIGMLMAGIPWTKILEQEQAVV